MFDINDFRKKATIKFPLYPKGYEFIVHRLGAGAELELSGLSREATKIISKLKGEPKEEEVVKLYDQITVINEKQLKIKATIFDDGKDGSISLALVKELTDDEAIQILHAVEAGENITSDQKVTDEPTA